VSLRVTRVEQFAGSVPSRARAVAQLRGSLNDTLSAVQFGVTVASLALGWLGEPALAPLIERPLHGLPHSQVFAHAISAVIALPALPIFRSSWASWFQNRSHSASQSSLRWG